MLGWHRITAEDLSDLEDFLSTGTLVSITDAIADKAVALSQQKKMSLGDSLIAATALELGVELVTRNTDDFKHIDGLRLFNPLVETP